MVYLRNSEANLNLRDSYKTKAVSGNERIAFYNAPSMHTAPCNMRQTRFVHTCDTLTRRQTQAS